MSPVAPHLFAEDDNCLFPRTFIVIYVRYGTDKTAIG
jgi:hypothetical protein